MTTTAALLLLTSAFMHAGWNLASKRQVPGAAFFLAASTALVPVAIVVGLMFRQDFLAFPPSVWGLLLLTGICQAVYFGALAGAYRAGDMTVAYPIARSAPIFIVIIQALALRRVDELTPGCIAGVVLTTLGCIVLPMHTFREIRWTTYLNRSCAFAVLAALGTTGYTVIDDQALRILRDTPHFTPGPFGAAFLYLTAEYVCTTACLATFVLAIPRERNDLTRILKQSPKTAALTGTVIYLTYGLVLVSLAFVDNVSYAAAFRQASIPIGALLAILILREPTHPPRITGVAIVTLGLILVALA